MKWSDCLSHQIWPHIEQGWKDTDKNVHFFWGLGANNIGLIKECESKGEEWWYVDVGYFTEQITRYPIPQIHNKDNTYFRIVKGSIHTVGGIHTGDTTRLDILRDKGIVEVYPGWAIGRKKILVCPSSPTVSYYINNMDQQDWIDTTVADLKKYTKREIVVRNKPRPNNKWWNKPILEDLKDTYCLVTNMSLAAVDAVTHNVPAIAHQRNVASHVTSRDISKIEEPFKPDVKTLKAWMTVLSEHQFTLDEIGRGVAYESLKKQYENKIL